MNSLRVVRRRALVAATLTMGTSLLLVLLYWRAVSGGSLPSPAQPLVTASQPVHSNDAPAKALALSAVPVPPAAGVGPSPGAALFAGQPSSEKPGPSLATKRAAPGDERTPIADAVAPAEETKKAAATNVIAAATTLVRSDTSNLATNVTREDERVARLWLANTNQRPAIKVRYQASDILQLSTELRRGLLVAGDGRTNRHEVFLQSNTAKAPLFGPLTKAMSEQYSGYALALGLSPVFDDVVRPLPAYFADGNYDLAFVPDRTLATEIFAKTASALRTFPGDVSVSNRIVFEGQLRLVGGHPEFSIVAAKQGTNLVSFARN